MSSSAEEANCDDGDILVPSSQQLRLSVDAYRPSKRRRLERDDESASDDSSQAESYDLPLQVNPEEDKFNNIKSKYDSYLHVPVHVDTHHDEFLTQADHPGSSPSAMRGPRWRKKTPPVLELIDQNVVLPSAATDGKSCARPFGEFDDIDVDDAELLEALAASQEHATTDTSADDLNSRSASDSRQKTLRQTTLFGMNTTQRTRPQGNQARKPNWPAANRIEPPTHHQLDKAAMETWVYPLNVGRIRDYQFNIVHRALYHNILVALPTGLGKTFIAATVMLNFFRWTKMAQIVFVAPTKPLVTQQVDACFHITGIPRSQTTLLTGEVSPAIRAEEWQEKRVFFMTPQTLVNDLKNGMADPKRIVLLVVDEAHKATGNYAYVEVVRFLRRFNSSFRVLALTATPGSTVEAVQKVVDGLGIARVEIRTEESMDIRSFVHTRKTELKIFDNSDEVENCLELFSAAVKPVLNKVASLNVYFSSDPRTMTLYGLMKGRERWAQSEAGRKANWGLKGTINACFKPLMSLAHNVELLKFHGIGPFYHKMKAFEDDTSVSKGKYAKQIVESESFRKLMSRTRGWINSDDFVGHPKLSYLNEVVLNHFLDAGHGVADGANESAPSNTRIMIFAHYRDSAEEINRVLNRHQPMIRAHVFVGQQGTKGSAGMDQKTQIDIIKKFKAGTYNTLVATSIGEEGLDIGEVDLIVCYDCSKSPIRMLQRMGRTGRKRAGQIVLLLMRGKEERDYFTAKDNYLKMQEIIEQGTEFVFHEEDSPRIVPREIQPVADKRLVEIPIENTQLGDLDPRKRKPKHAKRPPKRFNMPDGVDTGFAFLGGGKGKKAKTANNPPQPITDLVDAELPDLDSVVLTAEQETDLDRRYAQVAGDGMVYIERIRFDAHPGQMRQLCKTQLVRHSVTTTALVQASKVMLTHNRSWQRPAQPAQTPEVSQGLVEEQSQKPSRQSLATHKRTRTTLQKSTRNTKIYVDSDEYDSNDSFVDNRPLPQPDLTSSLEPFDSSAPIQRGVDENNNEERPFYVSQKDNLVLDSDEDDLPDVSSMIARQRSPGSSGGPSQPSSSVPKRPLQPSIRARKNGVRRVIDDSESDKDN